MKLLIRYGSGWILGAVAWVLAVGIGFLAIRAYEVTPGPSGQPVEHWPGDSRLALARNRHTLVMAVHPRCPCTRASAAELARILARCDGRVAVYILTFTPDQADRTWGHADWSDRLATIPGVQLIHDPGGHEAAQFGAQTSGHVALYAPDGQLLFRGGITGARGHEGGNPGKEAVLALIGGGSRWPGEYPVFGCPIVDPSQSPPMRGTTCIN
jgi:hypothetical protein